MPESKSGALTNLATPQRSLALFPQRARRGLYRGFFKKYRLLPCKNEAVGRLKSNSQTRNGSIVRTLRRPALARNVSIYPPSPRRLSRCFRSSSAFLARSPRIFSSRACSVSMYANCRAVRSNSSGRLAPQDSQVLTRRLKIAKPQAGQRKRLVVLMPVA